MARLLLINTGGTISMVPGAQGFVPEAGVAESLAREIVRKELPGTKLSIHSFEPLIDSADIRPCHWNHLLDVIRARQGCHDGIVITHGTDTLGYTAAALTFALPTPEAPVVLTGAMRPAAREGSDAEANLRAALIDASTGPKAVRVRFAGRSMPGDRVVKVTSSELDAFREVAAAPGTQPSPKLSLSSAMSFADKRVAAITITPGLPAEVLDAALGALDGVVLRAYGAGTLPSDPEFLAVLTAQVARGCKIVVISQCERGGVRLGEYASSAALRASGILDGGDLTTEAAVAKLALMLSDNGANHRQQPDAA